MGNLLCFQMVRAHAIAGLANKNTNKIFLWIGLVPGLSLYSLNAIAAQLISKAHCGDVTLSANTRVETCSR